MSATTCDALRALGVEHALAAAEAPPGLVTARQVHGVRLARAPADDPLAADAIYSCEPGVAVGVRTADCVPILLADPGRRMVAAIHAGWRGSAQGIAERAVRQLVRELALDAGELVAAIGPHIGPCCYEVDDPVRDAIDDSTVFSDAQRARHYMLDLFELNRRQLMAAGVSPLRVWRAGGCTHCDPVGYPSHRRDPQSGRMLHWLRLPVA